MTLNPDELSLLGFVREYGPISIEDLARASYVNVQEMKQLLSNLERKGLVRNLDNLYSVVTYNLYNA